MYQQVDKDLKTDICVHDGQIQTSCKRLKSFPEFSQGFKPMPNALHGNRSIPPMATFQSSSPPVLQ